MYKEVFTNPSGQVSESLQRWSMFYDAFPVLEAVFTVCTPFISQNVLSHLSQQAPPVFNPSMYNGEKSAKQISVR